MQPQLALQPLGILRWLGLAAAAAALLVGAGGCATTSDAEADAAVFRRAEAERVVYLEREVDRLRADLQQAEEAMIWIESGMRGVHTRADAVSALAEARVELESACERASWRAHDCEEARTKLEEADRQMHEDRLGTAVFFASRARRLAEEVRGEAARVADAKVTLFARNRVNLRSGPSTEDGVLAVLPEDTPVFPERRSGDWLLVRTHSGRVGWVYGGLLSDR